MISTVFSSFTVHVHVQVHLYVCMYVCMYVCSLRMLYLGSNKTDRPFVGASTYIQPVLLPMHALYVLVTLTMEMSILID